MLFSQFQPAGSVPESTLAQVEARVPPPVAQAWRQYGTGFVGDGYFRLVDPARAIAMLGAASPVPDDAVVVFTTAMADLVAWWHDYFLVVKSRLGEIHATQVPFERLVELMADVPGRDGMLGYRDAIWDQQPYPAARDRLGVPGFEDCFMHVPLLRMGGRGDAAAIQIGGVWPHVAMMTQLTGKPAFTHMLPTPTGGEHLD